MDVLESANQNQQYKNLRDLNFWNIDKEEFIKRQEKTIIEVSRINRNTKKRYGFRK